MSDICSVENCKNKSMIGLKSKLCSKHYYRFMKYGSLDIPEKKETILPNGIIKICKHHGKLKIDDVQTYKRNGKWSKQCKKCNKAYGINFYKRQMEIHKKKLECDEYKNAIPEKICNTHGKLEPHQIQVRGSMKKCRLCMNIQARKYEKNHKEDVLKIRRKFYQKNKTLYRKKSILKNKNLSIEQYELMINKQNNKCYICKKEETKKLKGEITALNVDHNHSTGEIRKLLCYGCNTGLGLFKEDINALRNAIKYLEEHS